MSEDYTVARYSSHGKKFEVLVDPELALAYKRGERDDFRQVLVFEEVYTDQKKGKRAANEDLRQVFDTTDPRQVAQKIVQKGEVLLKTEQRRKMVEEKRKGIVSYIARHCVDTRTGSPVPPTRVERALEEVEVNIDPFEDVEEQVSEVIRGLKQVIPISQQVSTVEATVPASFSGKAMGFLKSAGDIIDEEWLEDGSYRVRLVIPAGTKSNFMEKLGSITKGTTRIEMIEETEA